MTITENGIPTLIGVVYAGSTTLLPVVTFTTRVAHLTAEISKLAGIATR